MPELLEFVLLFLLIAIAAKQVGGVFSRMGLPYITGYLLVGVVAGPFILKAFPMRAVAELRFIDELSLGVIAFVAGSELYLKEIRPRLRSIATVIGAVLLVALPVGSIALFVMTDFIPFAKGMSGAERIAIGVLGGTILLALSPPSTIAVIKELRASGPFTRTLLGITVTMDVIIVILFAVAVAIASALIHNIGFNVIFLGLLALDLFAALFTGYIVGKMLQGILSIPIHGLVKTGLILLLGYGIFAASHWITEMTHTQVFELHIEPLLVAMIGGFYVTNFTVHRDQFEGLLHDVSPYVYVAFFTLTGIGIKLDILTQTWVVALSLFLIRAISINVGSYLGTRLAKQPREFRRFMGLALVTQAGIALGLSREVAIEFPSLGEAFATMVISVVVLNEIFGPMLLKSALKGVGEATLPGKHDSRSEGRQVVLLGLEAQSMALATHLRSHHWEVALVDMEDSHLLQIAEQEGFPVHRVDTINGETLNGVVTDRTDALLSMLHNDEENANACELGYHKGVKRLIVRPRNMSNVERFSNFGALVVDPASAMVHLFEQTITIPSTAEILLHKRTDRELRQITISNPDVDGMLCRELRLPPDIIFLDVTRNGTPLVPNGFTRLKRNDDVTLLGTPESLEDATLRLGF